MDINKVRGAARFCRKDKGNAWQKSLWQKSSYVSKAGSCTLKVPALDYNDVFEGKMGLLSSENRLIWDIHPVK
jgi:putative transposase